MRCYEENIAALAAAESLADIQAHRWPDPDWWDLRPVKSVIRDMNRSKCPLPHGRGVQAGVAVARDGELPHGNGRRQLARAPKVGLDRSRRDAFGSPQRPLFSRNSFLFPRENSLFH